MRRLLLACCMLLVAVGTPVAVGVVAAGPAGASSCGPTSIAVISSSFSPNPVVEGASSFENDVTITNCTTSTQDVSYMGSVSAPSTCGDSPFDFGPIDEMIAGSAAPTFKQPIDPAPSCTGTWSQYIELDQGTTKLDSETVTFTVNPF